MRPSTDRLPLPSALAAAQKHPGIRILPLQPSAADLDALARCFCGIYGSAERAEDGGAIWGEGWRCLWCGIERPLGETNDCPSCGASACAPVNELAVTRHKIAQALRPASDWHPVACVLEQGRRVAGFAYGAVTTPQRAVAHLGTRLREYQTDVTRCGGALARVDLAAALPAATPVFYVDEICVELQARNGGRALQGLSAVLFAGAIELGARGSVGFTSERAAPARLLPVGGGEISARTGDLAVFRFQDHAPITKLLHHLSPLEFLGLLAMEAAP